MAKKLTNKMWNTVKGKTIEENNIDVKVEHTLLATSLINETNTSVNTAYADMVEVSNALCSKIANGENWTMPEYNSTMDKVFMDACIIEGEFTEEKRLYELTKEFAKTDIQIETAKDLHSQVVEKQKKYTKAIDGATENPELLKHEYMASRDDNFSKK